MLTLDEIKYHEFKTINFEYLGYILKMFAHFVNE
jgi:hypothetical protein